MAMTLEEIKTQLDEALKQNKQISQLDNQIKSKTVLLENLERNISAKEDKLANLDKEFREKNASLINRLESEKTEWDKRVSFYKSEEERIFSERNGLAMEKTKLESAKADVTAIALSYGKKEKSLKHLIEEMQKIFQ